MIIAKIRKSRTKILKYFKLFHRYGFDGESCILKAICDVSQHKYSQNNGVIGDIVHILFK